MNKSMITLGLATCLSLVPAHGDDFEDLRVIRRAYQDQLFLFVEEKASEFLNREGLDLSSQWAREAQVHLVGALVERGAFREALLRCENLELTSQLTYLKARALYGMLSQTGEPLPSGEKRPSELIQSVLKDLKGSDKVMAKYVMAQDHFDVGESTLSSALLKDIVEEERLFRFHTEARFLYGRSLYQEDPPKFQMAFEVFKSLLAKFPNTVMSCRYAFWMGECSFELNQLHEAETHFKSALDLSPDDGTILDVHYNLGWLYVAMGRIDDAVQELAKVVSSPLKGAERYQASARYKLASIAMTENQPNRVLAWLKPVMQGQTLQHEAALLTAQAWMTLSNWEQALGPLKFAGESLRNEVRLEANRLLGRVHLQLGDQVSAEAVLMDLIDQEVPLDFRIDVQLQLAELYFATGDIYRSQDIYLQILSEKSRKYEPMLHYNLAKCSMLTNPLMECLFRRDDLLEQFREKRIGKARFSSEKDLLSEKVKQVMSKIWIMASSKASVFKKDEVLDALSRLSQVSLDEKRAEILAEYREAGPDIPSDIGLQSAVLMKMIDLFAEALWKDGVVPSYDLAEEAMGSLAQHVPALQITAISRHLDHIIDMDEESPYLPLAHYEKYELYRQQGLMGDALESLHHAIEHTADPSTKAQYLMQMARTEIQVARSIEGDTKTRNFKLQKALGDLAHVVDLSSEYLKDSEVVDLRFTAHRLLMDYDKAEAVLVEYLFQMGSTPATRHFDEQLISFYHSIERPIKAAQRRLHLASQLSGMEAQRQRYEAAMVFLENASTQAEGVDLLNQLSGSEPASEWTFRAGLKTVDMAQRSGDLLKATSLMESLVSKSSALEPHLQLEILLTRGRLMVSLDQVDQAIMSLEDVLAGSKAYPSLRAEASLELGKALKKRDAMRSASIFLEFYYRYPKHEKAQEALYESCRLKAMNLDQVAKAQRDQKVIELKRLVSKIERERERESLMTYLASIEL